MSDVCKIAADAGAVRAILNVVDCNTRDFAQRGYDALTGDPAFQSAVTVVLTIYVALVGYRLLFAPEGARLSDGPRTALKIGAVLALITSWGLFETLVFDVATEAPTQIAQLVSLGGATHQRAGFDPVGRLQQAYDKLGDFALAFSAAAAASAGATPAGTQASQTAPRPSTENPALGATLPAPSDSKAQLERLGREFQAAQALTHADVAILTVDAGLIAAALLLVGVLSAIGPIFVVLFLFRETRGFFMGWVRALAAAALASLGAWVLVLLMLAALDPWLAALAKQEQLNALNPATATTAASIVFVFTGAQIAMAVAAAIVAVGFRLGLGERAAAGGPATESRSVEASAATPAPGEMLSRPNLLADQLRRFDSVFAERGRAAAIAAAAGTMRVVTSTAETPFAPASSGYRRAELSRDRPSRPRTQA